MNAALPPPLPRRAVLRSALAAAGATLAAGSLAGCATGNQLAAALKFAQPVPLSVFILGGAGSSRGDDVPGDLRFLVSQVQAAVNQAKANVRGVGQITFATGNSTTDWFPLPSTLYNVGGQAQVRTDDPSLPMPDIVIAPHSVMPDYLAARALDLGPYVRQYSSILAGVPSTAIRLGQAFATGRSTFQAAVPLMRIPLCCLVQPGVTAIYNKKAWTIDQFTQALAGIRRDFPDPNGSMPFIPYGSGVAEMAAVGSGGLLGSSAGAVAQATFADGAVGQAVTETTAWAQYCPSGTSFRTPEVDYGILMYDGQTLLSGAGPVRIGRSAKGPVGTGWTVAPVPSFSTKAAVPVRTVDVMVFRHSKSPDQAAALAMNLLSEDVQGSLLTIAGALVLRPDQATRQLTALGTVQGPDLLVSSANDMTLADAWPARTDDNSASLALAQQNLTAALQALVGGAGNFTAADQFSGPGTNNDGNFSRFFRGASSTNLVASDVLKQAEQDANTGKTYSANSAG